MRMENEKLKRTEKGKKKNKERNSKMYSVILSIFEVGFESFAEALGVLHKIFLLLFHHLINKNRLTFSSTYRSAFMCVHSLLFMYLLTRLFTSWYLLKAA